MEISVFGAVPSERLARFEVSAQTHGCTVRLIPPGKMLGDFGTLPGGIVVFVNDDAEAAGLLAWAADQVRYLSSPLIAIATTNEAAEKQRLLAAGANLVCGPGMGDEEIIAQMQKRREAQPVALQLRAELLDPICEAVSIALREMASAEVMVRSLYRRASPISCGDITGVIRLHFASDGFLAVSVPTRTGSRLTSRILSENAKPGTPGDDLIQDCIGEVTNVVSGQTKALLARTQFHFTFSSAPAVMVGPCQLPATPGMDCFVIAFGSDCGDFAIQIGMGREVGAH